MADKLCFLRVKDENGNWISVPATTGPAGPAGVQGPPGPAGASMEELVLISGTGAPGTTDTYQVVLSNSQTAGTFNVYNGADGGGAPGSSLPLMDGFAAVGTADVFAREDHVHPSDTSKINVSDLSSDTPEMDGTGSAGTSTDVSRADHVHPVDTSRASASDVSSLQGDVSSLQGDVSDLQSEITNIQKITTGSVTISTAVSDGHIRVYRVGKVCIVKIYINYNANVAQNGTMATLQWAPNDIMFTTLHNATSGTFLEAQLNTDGTLQNRSTIASGSWILGELVYFTSD